jgi:hypothetical protein
VVAPDEQVLAQTPGTNFYFPDFPDQICYFHDDN